MTPFPPERVDAGATNPPNPGETATPSGNDGSGELSGSPTLAMIDALAALLEPEAFDPDVKAAPEWRERAKDTALAYAAKVISVGYRRVVEDEATVERVASVLATVDGWRVVDGQLQPDSDYTLDRAVPVFGTYTRRARAVVRALREDTP